MKSIIIIPSRYESQRLPKKPLALIAGKTLVERVYERASKVTGIYAVYVATDHTAIRDAVIGFGGHVIMTPPGCPSGTDRVAEAAEQLRLDDAIIVNVQGDEPLVEPAVISRLIREMEMHPEIAVATPIAKLMDRTELHNPNIVKVVLNKDHNALYFSRSAIPFVRDRQDEPERWMDGFQFYKHIGLYAYRMSAIRTFVSLSESKLEKAERLEQLRLLEAGIPIRCVEVEYESYAVDTAEDVLKVEAVLKARGLA